MSSAHVPECGIVDVQFGAGVKVVEPANLYGCTLGDDCFVGPFVEIQRGVIGRAPVFSRTLSSASWSRSATTVSSVTA